MIFSASKKSRLLSRPVCRAWRANRFKLNLVEIGQKMREEIALENWPLNGPRAWSRGPLNSKFRILNSFLLKRTDMKFHQNRSSGSKVIQEKRVDRQTDRQTDDRQTTDRQTPSTIHIQVFQKELTLVTHMYDFLFSLKITFQNVAMASTSSPESEWLRSQTERHIFETLCTHLLPSNSWTSLVNDSKAQNILSWH